MSEEEKHVTGAAADWILATLEPDQLALAKKIPVPRRQLTGGELALLWTLRVYLVFMLVVVFWQAWLAVK
ncbi:MAG TPA: hypothetical protein VHX13_04870 [Acidobacteriaceae bacterium]|nr:hypothetical protein [Acidobacteriaceae bacterium]